jgi:hypothetical protein
MTADILDGSNLDDGNTADTRRHGKNFRLLGKRIAGRAGHAEQRRHLGLEPGRASIEGS